MVAHYDLVVLDDHVFDGHLKVGKFFERGPNVLDRTRRSLRHSPRHVRSAIHKPWCEILFADAQILPVHEFFKVVADEFLHLSGCVMPVLVYFASEAPAAAFMLGPLPQADAA